jgi:serine protease inhibitor
MIILNAIYFFGEWVRKFKSEDTKESLTNNSTQKVNMMNQKKDMVFYYKNSDVEIIDLQY